MLLDSVKVHIYHNDSEVEKGGYKGLLEPYLSLMQVSCNDTAVKPKVEVVKLPRLPVPKLKDTLAKYLLSVRPFVNNEEFTTALNLVKDFQIGVGAKLQGGYKGLLEPYLSLMQVSCNDTAVKPKVEVVKLPRLPVPKLKDTLAKYLLSVRPFVNNEEFTTALNLVKDFQIGVGAKLQTLLEERAKHQVNWLEDWWLKTSYLGYRDPVVVYSNPGAVLPPQKFETQEDQLQYAAKTILAALEYRRLINNNELPPETMMGKHQLDMGQYKKVFGTCRIPRLNYDELSYNSDSSHFIIIHNNHIFRIDLWGEDNVMLSESQIVEQLKQVIQKSSTPDELGVGILTSEHRDNWAQAFALLSADPVNRNSLDDIETSIAVLCLDAPSGLSESATEETFRNAISGQTLHGGGSKSNGSNRWYDKTIQFIVGADGYAGITYEHCPAEGQPIAILSDFLIRYISEYKSSGEHSTRPLQPKYLNFVVTPEVSNMINNAKENLDKLVENLELNCFRFNKYGKNFIKAQKLSPDSYIQMAIQYAFYRLYKEPGAHYESAATRMYEGGRTETIRSCSVESIEFSKTMLNHQSTTKDKIVALKAAVNSHKNYTVQAIQGLGIDRHFLGLKLLAIENGIPLHKLYLDASYTRSSHMRLTTSQVAFKSDSFMCYAPRVRDGYATCYSPRDEDINFATSAFTDQPDTACKVYRNALEQSLEDMHYVLLQNTLSSKL